MAMATQSKLIKPNNRTKCLFCKKKGHTEVKCWKKHPDLRPNKAKETKDRPNEVYLAEEKEEIALHSETPRDIGTWYLDSAATSHICAYKDLF